MASLNTIPAETYSPYTFIYVLTGIFGTVFAIGPLLVPRGPDQMSIRVTIMLAAFHMWIAWLTVYSSQIHPVIGLEFKNSTLAWISYSWGNGRGIVPLTLPITSTTISPTTTTTTTTTTARPRAYRKLGFHNIDTTLRREGRQQHDVTTFWTKEVIKAREKTFRTHSESSTSRSIARSTTRPTARPTTRSTTMSTGSTTKSAITESLSLSLLTVYTRMAETSAWTRSKKISRTKTAFFIANEHYSYHRAIKEPIILKVPIELEEYREFFVMLSESETKSYPRIVIHIGAERGTKCFISRDGVLRTTFLCELAWRKNSHLFFWIWFRNGYIAVKSNPDKDETNLLPFMYWSDPKPFAVNFYGFRTPFGETFPLIIFK